MIDFLQWAILVFVLIVAFSIALWSLFQFGFDHGGEDSCGAVGVFDRNGILGVLPIIPRLSVAILGSGEEYVTCFEELEKDSIASILVFVFLVLAVVILMNMLIAMMAKTFDRVFEAYVRNYKVMRVKLFVAYSYRGFSPPLSLLGFPYFILTWLGRLVELSRWNSADFESFNEPSSTKKHLAPSWLRRFVKLLTDSYPEAREERYSADDLDSVVPAQYDAVNSSAFQMNKWNESIDPTKKLNRAILPTKTLLWIAKVDRLYDAASKLEEDDVAEEEAQEETDMVPLYVCKFDVYSKLITHVKETIKAGIEHGDQFEALLQNMSAVRRDQALVQSHQAAFTDSQASAAHLRVHSHRQPPELPPLPPITDSPRGEAEAAQSVTEASVSLQAATISFRHATTTAAMLPPSCRIARATTHTLLSRAVVSRSVCGAKAAPRATTHTLLSRAVVLRSLCGAKAPTLACSNYALSEIPSLLSRSFRTQDAPFSPVD